MSLLLDHKPFPRCSSLLILLNSPQCSTHRPFQRLLGSWTATSSRPMDLRRRGMAIKAYLHNNKSSGCTGITLPIRSSSTARPSSVQTDLLLRISHKTLTAAVRQFSGHRQGCWMELFII
ncbi:hypothetical protein CPC08DRAFT_715617 [Agrocybe pediades]|nr:hypothetical protein CPC08DRAFT_715617 [Agrocybe pediades]